MKKQPRWVRSNETRLPLFRKPMKTHTETILAAKLLEAEVESILLDIYNSQGDYEHAHSLEDQMFVKVLRALANCTSPSESYMLAPIATNALKSLEIKFPRYCA